MSIVTFLRRVGGRKGTMHTGYTRRKHMGMSHGQWRKAKKSSGLWNKKK